MSWGYKVYEIWRRNDKSKCEKYEMRELQTFLIIWIIIIHFLSWWKPRLDADWSFQRRKKVYSFGRIWFRISKQVQAWHWKMLLEKQLGSITIMNVEVLAHFSGLWILFLMILHPAKFTQTSTSYNRACNLCLFNKFSWSLDKKKRALCSLKWKFNGSAQIYKSTWKCMMKMREKVLAFYFSIGFCGYIAILFYS
jgi:hypothetical protein